MVLEKKREINQTDFFVFLVMLYLEIQQPPPQVVCQCSAKIRLLMRQEFEGVWGDSMNE